MNLVLHIGKNFNLFLIISSGSKIAFKLFHNFHVLFELFIVAKRLSYVFITWYGIIIDSFKRLIWFDLTCKIVFFEQFGLFESCWTLSLTWSPRGIPWSFFIVFHSLVGINASFKTEFNKIFSFHIHNFSLDN